MVLRSALYTAHADVDGSEHSQQAADDFLAPTFGEPPMDEHKSG